MSGCNAGCAYLLSDEFIERLIDIGGMWQVQGGFVIVAILGFVATVAYCEWDMRRFRKELEETP